MSSPLHFYDLKKQKKSSPHRRAGGRPPPIPLEAQAFVLLSVLVHGETRLSPASAAPLHQRGQDIGTVLPSECFPPPSLSSPSLFRLSLMFSAGLQLPN